MQFIFITHWLIVQQFLSLLSSLEVAAGMEDAELPNLGGEHGMGLDNAGQKHPEFANRPAGK